MLSKRTDAYEEATAVEEEARSARYVHAYELLAEQTAALLSEDDGEGPELEAHHAPYRPHWRGLSSAARRLIRAHEHVEETAPD